VSDSSTSSGGIGFCGLLGVLFIALKLTHAINWSWLWVLAPLWGGFVLALAIIMIVIAIAMVVSGRN
jgi:hypothetical protein